MSDRIQWGLLAAGGIAHSFADGVKASKTGAIRATASRDLENAKSFADKHGGRAYGSYEQLLADPEVDAVYISTPHHLHLEWTIKAAEAGKTILCEKPFTLNAHEAQMAIDAVKKAGVFFMEAFMYRCTPQTIQLRKLLKDGEIGTVLAINAEFGFAAGKDWSNFRTDARYGGGGLMDVGCYCVSLSRLAAGDEPEAAFYAPKLSRGGYDEYGSGCMRFPNGVTAAFGTGIHASMKNDARIYGSEGWIHLDSPWFGGTGSRILLNRNGKDPVEIEQGISRAELYASEVDAVAEFRDAKECPHMRVADTLGNMRALDMLRASCGLKFEAEMTGATR